jgi:hypothetical protein
MPTTKLTKEIPKGTRLKIEGPILIEVRLQGVLARHSQKPRFETYGDEPGQKMARVYAHDAKPFTTPDGKDGIEVRFPADPGMIRRYEEAAHSGHEFKFYTLREGIHVYTEKSAAERIKAHNRNTDKKHQLQPINGYAHPFSFDIVNKVAILKVFFI